MVRVKPAILISSFYVALSDLPHSRQQVLWRDVINPQNGHIRCDMKSRPPGLEVEGRFANESVMEASLLRKRSRSRRKLGSIHLAYAISPSAGIASNEPGGISESSFLFGISGKTSHPQNPRPGLPLSTNAITPLVSTENGMAIPLDSSWRELVPSTSKGMPPPVKVDERSSRKKKKETMIQRQCPECDGELVLARRSE